MKKLNGLLVCWFFVGCGYQPTTTQKHRNEGLRVADTTWISIGSTDGSLPANWSNGVPTDGVDAVVKGLAEGGSDVSILSGTDFGNTNSFRWLVSAQNKSQLGTSSSPITWGGSDFGGSGHKSTFNGWGKVYINPDNSLTANTVIIIYGNLNTPANFLNCIGGEIAVLYNRGGQVRIGGNCTIASTVSVHDTSWTVIEKEVGALASAGALRVRRGIIENYRTSSSGHVIRVFGGRLHMFVPFHSSVAYEQTGGYCIYRPYPFTAPAFSLDVWDGILDASQNSFDALANMVGVDKGLEGARVLPAIGSQFTNTTFGTNLEEEYP